MKASKLIKLLQKEIADFGDQEITVVIDNSIDGCQYASEEITVQSSSTHTNEGELERIDIVGKF